MKLSISNLSWGDTPIEVIAPKLSKIGMHGIEVAPTAVWGSINEVTPKDVVNFAKKLKNYGLEISGIQSLLYGHPELQMFNRSCWPAMQAHLYKNFMIGSKLGASVAVFGSPKNRIRNFLSMDAANEMATDFFIQLLPNLEEANLVLTLEPNAPQYGADFLIDYKEVVNLVNAIDSPWIKAQIDTGCALMVNDQPASIYKLLMQSHIHLSTPNLLPVPSSIDFKPFLETLYETNYQKWLVIEILGNSTEAPTQALYSAEWLASMIRSIENFK